MRQVLPCVVSNYMTCASALGARLGIAAIQRKLGH